MPDPNQVMVLKINQGESDMHILAFVISLIGFGLEVASFLMRAGVL